MPWPCRSRAAGDGLAALVLFLGACAPTPTPTSVRSLATDHRPAAPEPGPWARSAGAGRELALRPGSDEDSVWIEALLPTEAWELAPAGDSVWRARRPFAPISAAGEGPRERLIAERELVRAERPKELVGDESPPDSFASYGEQVYVKTSGGAPGSVRYLVQVGLGRSEGGRWRASLDRYRADGWLLFTDRPTERAVSWPAGGALTFATAAICGPEQGSTSASVRFRVELDGEEILSHEQSVGSAAQADRHRVELPEDPRREGRLTFHLDGPAAVGMILAPLVVPPTRETPVEEAPPDVLLFLADTFRADNLAAYGSPYDPPLTPRLDAFAAESVVFTSTWSPASWTLPATASMMTGLFPHQHGADASKLSLNRALPTLAEQFAEAGYRTAAITDAILVSRRFGFDQGFEWFDESENWTEKPEGWKRTLDEVAEFLDSDDGRPFFLFVQTYRSHGPYVVTPRTRSSHGESLRLEREWDELFEGLFSDELAREGLDPSNESLVEVVEGLEGLYRGGVVDLDRGFGRLLEELDERGLGRSTWVAFTSDHGDAFGEHLDLFHGNGVWEEHVRVPLLVRGPRTVPRLDPRPASLVDLPRTLAGLAEIEPHPRWGGMDLFEGPAREATFSFECPGSGRPGRAAIMSADRKVILEPDEDGTWRPVAAFDLATDPLEQHDVLAEDAAWPAELLERFSGELETLQLPLARSPRADLSAEDLADLAAVGYVDEE